MSLDPTASESRAQSAFQSLSAVIGPLPSSPQFSDNPSLYLLHNPDVSRQISGHLRQADSGAGDDNLCRWLYDTFQSMDPELQLVVLQFVPTIAGVYLTRALLRKPQAGFEAVLLALYAHETMSRGGQPLTVNISSLSHPSLYHENKNNNSSKNRAVELNLAILSPALEPHGTVRSTKRARIVGVALELYYTKIWMMPISSKVDFCEFCVAWAGQDGCEEEEEEMEGSQCSVHHSGEIGGEVVSCDSDPVDGGGEEVPTGGESGEKGGRIPLPWELFQPILRILGHCLLGPSNSEELRSSAMAAVRCLYARAIHDMMPPAILAARSLLRLGKMRSDSNGRLLDFGALDDLRDAAETLSITGS